MPLISFIIIVCTVYTMSLPSYKLALVTGASAGIGRAVAVQLAARGIKVIIIVMMMMMMMMIMLVTRWWWWPGPGPPWTPSPPR